MSKKVSIIPFYSWQSREIFFSKDAEYNFPYYLEKKLSENGYNVSIITNACFNEADFFVFFNLEFKFILKAFLNGKLRRSVYIPFEPPVVRPLHSPENLKVIAKSFSYILTWQDDLAGTDNFKKFYFPLPDLKRRVNKKSFDDRKFITTIVGFKKSSAPNELYSHRIEAIRYFEKKYPDSFQFFGVGWNPVEYPSYGGAVDDKLEKLSEYKFAICYENECKINGLLSEKIFDCFYAGVVPIFWGAENIDQYVPEKCYIDKRKFSDYDVLCNYIETMTASEYAEKIEAIDEYLESSAFKRHSSESFSNTIADALTETKYSKNRGIINFSRLIFLILKIKLYRSFLRIYKK